ncbi:histidine phosphatase family protein [Oceanobacillus neutriphilus]|uniref:Phosphoglycerate mutase n=1 Tax=Oceanobacillus neutriphilus TaxID=531815 RepID=A0ABQ2NS55_9BACI|nr:histidine phosphatase family protein [Oceanobacillus neutriphilus]GGP08486.1 phosphoglycerate mutase [Oceanobacillus neutriphilus]
MKKTWLVLMFSLMMMFVLMACATSGESDDESVDASEDKVEAQEEPEEVTIYLVRHGKTILNNTDRVQGWADGPLIPSGEELIEDVGEGLADVPFAAAYSSDSGRAIQTAHLILEANVTEAKNLGLIEEQGIREAYFGIYEGEENEIMRGEAAEHLGYSNAEELMTSGGNIGEKVMNAVSEIDESGEAENYQELKDRTFTAFQEIAEEAYQNGGGDVLVVSHGITMESILSQIDETKLPDGGFKNGSVTKIIFDGEQWEVVEVNELKYAE